MSRPTSELLKSFVALTTEDENIDISERLREFDHLELRLLERLAECYSKLTAYNLFSPEMTDGERETERDWANQLVYQVYTARTGHDGLMRDYYGAPAEKIALAYYYLHHSGAVDIVKTYGSKQKAYRQIALKFGRPTSSGTFKNSFLAYGRGRTNRVNQPDAYEKICDILLLLVDYPEAYQLALRDLEECSPPR